MTGQKEEQKESKVKDERMVTWRRTWEEGDAEKSKAVEMREERG
jgi:hypothetical protein